MSALAALSLNTSIPVTPEEVDDAADQLGNFISSLPPLTPELPPPAAPAAGPADAPDETTTASNATSPSPPSEAASIAAAVTNAIETVAAAMARSVTVDGPPLAVATPGLSLVAESRTSSKLAEAPFEIPSSSEKLSPASVQLPANLFGGGGASARRRLNVDETKPVVAKITVVDFDVHSTVATSTFALSGPTLSFSLLQDGQELNVSGIETPILLQVPDAAFL